MRYVCCDRGGVGERRKLETLREDVAIGIDALEQGDFVDLADAELEGYLKRPRMG